MMYLDFVQLLFTRNVKNNFCASGAKMGQISPCLIFLNSWSNVKFKDLNKVFCPLDGSSRWSSPGWRRPWRKSTRWGRRFRNSSEITSSRFTLCLTPSRSVCRPKHRWEKLKAILALTRSVLDRFHDSGRQSWEIWESVRKCAKSWESMKKQDKYERVWESVLKVGVV